MKHAATPITSVKIDPITCCFKIATLGITIRTANYSTYEKIFRNLAGKHFYSPFSEKKLYLRGSAFPLQLARISAGRPLGEPLKTQRPPVNHSPSKSFQSVKISSYTTPHYEELYRHQKFNAQ